MRTRLLFLFALLMVAGSGFGQVMALRDYHYFPQVSAGQVLINVMDNDWIDGQPATAANAFVTALNIPASLTLSADGWLTVNSLTGPWDVTYEICSISNPNRCARAYVSIETGSLDQSAPEITITQMPDCANNVAELAFTNFPVSSNFQWCKVRVTSPDGTYQEQFPINGPVVFTNVKPGVNGIGMVDCEDIGVAEYDFYVPESECGLTLDIEGVWADVNTNGLPDVGDMIDYSIKVTNHANTELTNITAELPGLTVIGTPLTLAAGASDSTTFSAGHTLTQNDINTGFVRQFATASGWAGAVVLQDIAESLSSFRNDGFRLEAFLDTNGNGIKDANEYWPYGHNKWYSYELNNSGQPVYLTNSVGGATVMESNPSNAYHVIFHYENHLGSAILTSEPLDISVPTGSGIVTHYIPVTLESAPGYAIRLEADLPIRPGTAFKQTLRMTNTGGVATSAGTVTYTKDPRFTITQVSRPVTMTPTGFAFVMNAMAPQTFQTVVIDLQAPNLPDVAIGEVIMSSVSTILDVPDGNTANDADEAFQQVAGSFDPNDISEAHRSQILIDDFTSNDYLTYTIRFENTGNADAINIEIRDLLDGQLDENSVRMVSSSHGYLLQRAGSQLTWRLDGIYLPPAGTGYLTFDVKPKPGYAVGDVIPNTAEIYFDFNPAIVTNTWETEFVETLKTEAFVAGDVKLYPNPVKDQLHVSTNEVLGSVTVYDIFGKVLLQQTVATKETVLDVSGLASGLYLVKTGQGQTFKIVKQ